MTPAQAVLCEAADRVTEWAPGGALSVLTGVIDDVSGELGAGTADRETVCAGWLVAAAAAELLRQAIHRAAETAGARPGAGASASPLDPALRQTWAAQPPPPPPPLTAPAWWCPSVIDPHGGVLALAPEATEAEARAAAEAYVQRTGWTQAVAVLRPPHGAPRGAVLGTYRGAWVWSQAGGDGAVRGDRRP